MPSYLQREKGVYEPGKRYAFTNISEDPFPIKWNGKIVKVVQPHETIEISDATPYPGSGNGDCIARTKTIELTNAIILGEARIATEKLGFLTDKGYISPLGTRAAIPAARKPYEDKILQEMDQAENIELLNELKAEEIIADARRQQGISYSNQKVEFANAPKGGETFAGKEESPEIPKLSDIPKATESVTQTIKKTTKPKVSKVNTNESPATTTNRE